MTSYDNENLMINIQNAADSIAAYPRGAEIVNHVLSNYGANSIENLSPCNFAEVFDELDFIASDLR